MKELTPGEFIKNTACVCGASSDGMSLYKHEEEDGEKYLTGYCRSGFCERPSGFISREELEEVGVEDIMNNVSTKVKAPIDFSYVEDLPFRGWRERRITKTTSEKFGVRSSEDEDGEIVARHYPITKNGEIVGYKKRKLPKDFIGLGDTKADCELFGQNVFPPGGKYLVITTGEEDAMAACQILKSEKGDVTYWNPVVSITCGDGSIIKQLKANFEYVSSFEKVVFMFDQDDSAQKYIPEAAKLLKPGQSFIAKLSLKDASDMLRLGKAGDLRQAFWKAEPFNRVDILHLNQLWDEFENEDMNDKIPFPRSWSLLNEMMNGGGERGEITLIGALTSIGKSTLLANISYDLIENTKFKVGAMYLEGTKREVVRDLLSLDMSVNLRRVDRKTLDMKKLKNRFFEYLAAKDQFVYVDHQGSISNDEIFDKLNYLAKGEDCDVIIIDPIQAAVNSSDNKAIIEFMDTLLKFVKETNTYVIVVSHMKKPDTDNPHDVTEYDLLGSSSLNTIPFNTILMSRDKMSSDPNVRNATKLQMVKCRRTGETGEAGWLRYDIESTHMFTTSNPYEEATLDDPQEDDPDFFSSKPEISDSELF